MIDDPLVTDSSSLLGSSLNPYTTNLAGSLEPPDLITPNSAFNSSLGLDASSSGIIDLEAQATRISDNSITLDSFGQPQSANANSTIRLNASIDPLTGQALLGSTREWNVQFWDNKTLSGALTWEYTDSPGVLNFNAGTGAPPNTTGISADNFSARWETTSYFNGGFYDFISQADDGVRIYIDDVKVIDKWQDQSFVRNDAYVAIPEGDHKVVVEYFESGGNALNTLRWEATGLLEDWTGAFRPVGYDGSGVSQTYVNTFERDGGISAIGAPSDNVHPWGDGYTQDFSGGSDGRGAIMKSNANDNSYWVGGAIWDKFNQLGAVDGMGYPTTDRISINGGVVQNFQENRKIWLSTYGAFSTWGGIGGKYESLGGANSFLGFPTSGEIGIGDGWIIQHFAGGDILYKEGQPTVVYDLNAINGLPADSGHGSTSPWNVQFWNNQNQNGSPTWSRTDPAGELRFAAGTGGPPDTRGIQEDHFSARWTTTSDFAGGFYDLVSQADDGVGVYIDGIKVIDQWHDQPFVRNDAYTVIPAGSHTIQVDYFENAGNAINTLRWNPSGLLTDWNGSFLAVGYDGSGVSSTYVNTFQRDGAISVLGAPSNNVHPWENGYTQDFSGGSDGRGAIMKSNANDNSYWVGGDFWNKFLDTGGAGGILGYPTSDDYSTNGGLRQDFQGGALLQSSNGIFPIFGGVGYQYLHFEGGEKGRLGFPTSGEIGLGNGVIIQNFEHGYILYGSGATRTVINGSEIAVGYDGSGVNSTFTDTFDRDGGWNALGSASNNVHRWEGGYTQDFLGGSDGRGAIMKSDANNNSYWVGGDFWNKFLDTGGAGGILGYPTSDDYSTNGGLRQDFQGGALLQSSNGIFPIFGGVGYQYLHFEGGEKGRLGFPTSGEIGLGNGVIIQNFEHGYILYGSGPTRTVINGSEIAVGYDGNGINSTFTDTFDRGGGWNALGSASNNVHRWEGGYTQDFSGGSDSRGAIMKSDANNNSYWVGGDFWNKFLDTGGAGGILGYATSDRYSTNGGLRQDFQGGAIFKTSNGIFSVYGGIGSYYFGTLNGETGQLGFPTSGENGIGNGVIRQNFENGYILWNGNATAYHNDGTPLFGGSNGGSGSGSTIGIPVDFNSSVYSSDNPFWRAGYGGPNCTWYVNGRLKELGYRVSVLDGMLGNAHLWDNQAPGAGATVSNQVQVGAIAVWESNRGGAGELGHVAVVEQINSDGSILISESNWSGSMYNTRTISPNTSTWPDHFILVAKDTVPESPGGDNPGGDNPDGNPSEPIKIHWEVGSFNKIIHPAYYTDEKKWTDEQYFQDLQERADRDYQKDKDNWVLKALAENEETAASNTLVPGWEMVGWDDAAEMLRYYMDNYTVDGKATTKEFSLQEAYSESSGIQKVLRIDWNDGKLKEITDVAKEAVKEGWLSGTLEVGFQGTGKYWPNFLDPSDENWYLVFGAFDYAYEANFEWVPSNGQIPIYETDPRAGSLKIKLTVQIRDVYDFVDNPLYYAEYLMHTTGIAHSFILEGELNFEHEVSFDK